MTEENYPTVLSAMQADLASLRESGSLLENTEALQLALEKLAASIDAEGFYCQTCDRKGADPRDQAAALKEIRATLDDIRSKTAGSDAEAWKQSMFTFADHKPAALPMPQEPGHA